MQALEKSIAGPEGVNTGAAVKAGAGQKTAGSKFDAAIIFIRYVVFILTSIIYLLELRPIPGFFGTGPLVVVILLFATILLMFAYIRLKGRTGWLLALLLLEAATVSLLLYYTGGLESPFILYSLNPLLISAFLPFLALPWLILSSFVAIFLLEAVYLGEPALTVTTFILENFDLLFSMALVTLTVQVFIRLYHRILDQSQILVQQQAELFSAYSSLAENHRTTQVLSNFQRDAVSCSDERDIFVRLITALDNSFNFYRVVVLKLDYATPPSHLSPRTPFEVLTPLNREEEYSSLPEGLAELKDKWRDFSREKMITGEKKDWVAIPVWQDDKTITAVFFGRLFKGMTAGVLPPSLFLFIGFTEQVIGNLNNYKASRQTLKHLSSLYEAVETISSRDNIKEVINLFAAYAKVLTGSEKAIFWIDRLNAGQGQDSFIYSVKGRRKAFPEEHWEGKLLQAWAEIKVEPKPVTKAITDSKGDPEGSLICIPVKSRSRCFGMVAVLQPPDFFRVEEITQTLAFLANLAAVAIERNLAELFADKLLLIEEQNRIANEMHDSVSQNLFSVVYGIDALIKQVDTMAPEFQKKILTTIRDLTAQTAKEMRMLIYRLSPRHRGDQTFINELSNYLKDLGDLNQVKIEFTVRGKEDYINSSIRRAFYRIIKEATNNAIRHGKARNISVKLEMTPFAADISIADNGEGFDVEGLNPSNGQLGLVNMKELVNSLQGTLSIRSKPGEGTVIASTVPIGNLPRISVNRC
ncbi:MAG TPA: hypothetical protein GX697_05720 [Firmicutes bacterium]|nr:hypothetical protein [Bacillota bacterium]